MRAALSVMLIGLLSACATVTSPVPEGYQGAVVQLADTGYQESNSKAAFFAALAVDGNDIQNSLRESRAASYGRGAALTSRYTKRALPVVPMRVTLTATHQTAAPIHELAARAVGTFFSVEGVVDFKPEEGHSYIVTGKLKKAESCVWIADSESKQTVTEKICEK